MNRKLLPLLLAGLMFVACNKYDDTEIKRDIANLEDRVGQLETLCERINQNATSLQSVVTAIQNRDAVTSVTSINQEGVIVGYTISFAKASTITIYNGKNGKDGANGNDGEKGDAGTNGHSPIIGVKLFEGLYYWTVDGEFITDDQNNKIQAQAKDGINGTDAITPKFRITPGRWELSTDGGSSWNDLGAATGADGSDGTSLIKSVDNSNNEFLTITLNDETVITLPKYQQMNLTLTLEKSYGISAGGSVNVPYVITGGGDAPKLTLFTQNGWKAVQTASTTTTGIIHISAPSDMKADKVVVIAEDGNGRTVMQTMTFAEGIITLTNASLTAAKEAVTLDCPLATNADYTVNIPIEAQSWLSVAEIDTRVMRNDVITFSLTTNTGLTRYTTVTLKDNGSLIQTIFIMQNGSSTVINVPTAGTLSTLVPDEIANNATALKITGTLNADDYSYLRLLISNKKLTDIDLSDLSDTEMPSSAFRDMTKLVKIIFPAGLTYFPEYVCHNCQNLVSINIPTTVKEIRQYAFSSTNNLATTTGVNGEMIIPDNVEYIRNNAFSNNSVYYKITKLHFGNGLKEIGNGAFRSFDFVEEITFNEGLLTIGDEAFCYLGYRNGDDKVSSPRPAIVLSSSLRTIGANAFQSAKLSSLDLGTGVRTIGNCAFYGAKIAGDIEIPENVTTLGTRAFYTLAQWISAILIINANITVIPNELCAGAQFKQVVMKNEVTEISSGAFRAMNKIITPLVLPAELVTIGEGAFRDGSTFTGTLNLPSKLETIGNNAFNGSTFTGSLTIPALVKTIGSGAFYQCKGFTGNLVIPNSVTSLGNAAFYQCSGFNGTLTIGTGIKILNGSTFRECTGLTGNIYIPDNIERVYEYEFYGCTGFNGTVHLPNNSKFTQLYGYVFQGCNNLTGTVTFPSSLTWIGGYSFKDCSKLSGNLIIPDNVQTIDLQAFYGCTGFNGKLVLGKGLTSIRSNVFANCINITSIQSKKASPPTIDATAFYGVTTTSLEVPVGATTAYEAATTWKNFTITEVSSFE